MNKDNQSKQVKNDSEAKTPVYNKMTQAVIEVSLPANYDSLPLIGTIVREFCAALPRFLKPENIPDAAMKRYRFGTGMLKLPGSEATITAGYSHFVYSVELILQEVASNIIRHGYGEKNPEAGLSLTLSVEQVNFRQYALVVEVSDTAPAFNPVLSEVEQPNPLELRESGYGMYLIHKLTDKLEYSRRDDRNYLKMVKYFSQ